MFSMPFATLIERLDACDANAMNCPEPVAFWLILGFSLSPFAGVVSFEEETSWVAGVQVEPPKHVSRT